MSIKTILCLIVFSLFVGCSSADTEAKFKYENHTMTEIPNSPNCVSSFAEVDDTKHYMEAIKYEEDKEIVKLKLMEAIEEEVGFETMEVEGNYIHATFKSKFFGFVDDGEFLFVPEDNQIDFKMGARTGKSDFGVNRKRMNRIKEKLN